MQCNKDFKDTFPTISPNVQESSCQALSGCKLLTRLVTNFTPPLMAILPYFVFTHTAVAVAGGGGTLQRRVRVNFWKLDKLGPLVTNPATCISRRHSRNLDEVR